MREGGCGVSRAVGARSAVADECPSCLDRPPTRSRSPPPACRRWESGRRRPPSRHPRASPSSRAGRDHHRQQHSCLPTSLLHRSNPRAVNVGQPGLSPVLISGGDRLKKLGSKTPARRSAGVARSNTTRASVGQPRLVSPIATSVTRLSRARDRRHRCRASRRQTRAARSVVADGLAGCLTVADRDAVAVITAIAGASTCIRDQRGHPMWVMRPGDTTRFIVLGLAGGRGTGQPAESTRWSVPR